MQCCGEHTTDDVEAGKLFGCARRGVPDDLAPAGADVEAARVVVRQPKAVRLLVQPDSASRIDFFLAEQGSARPGGAGRSDAQAPRLVRRGGDREAGNLQCGVQASAEEGVSMHADPPLDREPWCAPGPAG